jgi:hypothetical protein
LIQDHLIKSHPLRKSKELPSKENTSGLSGGIQVFKENRNSPGSGKSRSRSFNRTLNSSFNMPERQKDRLWNNFKNKMNEAMLGITDPVDVIKRKEEIL